MRTIELCAALAFVTAACKGSSPSTGADTTAAASGGDPSLTVAQKGSVLPSDHPVLDPGKRPVTSASVQRLRVSQLKASFPIVLGQDEKGNDITWIVGGQPGFDSMAGVLGQPNYDTTTDEDLTPSPLYAKFMDDAARDACSRVIAADATRADLTARSFIRYAQLTDVDPAKAPGIDQTLRYLKLRFHAVKVADGDDALIAPLRDLFVSGAQASTSKDADKQAESGWTLVCVALLTAPEFHLY